MANSITRADVAEGLQALGVRPDDALLVHSSLSSLGHVDGGADAVIDGLLDAVGLRGTILVPTHTWDRIHAANPVFDVRATSSCTGLIPETFRRRASALRGLHPTHSCAAVGPLSIELLEGHETQVTPCGRKSPYQRLMDRGGKIVFVGVTLLVNTSFHALEEMAFAPYLFDRFEMLYVVDYEGHKAPAPSRRHADGLDRAFAAMEPVLQERGALVRGQIGGATVRVVDAAAMERVLMPVLAEDPFCLLARQAAEHERRCYGQWQAERRRPAGA